jgi:hypothetical protein
LRFPEWGIWSLPFTAYEFGRWIIGEKFIEGLSDFFTEEKERLGMLIKTAAVQELIDSGDLAVSDVKDGEIQNLAPDIDHLRHCSLAGEDVSDRLVQKLIQHEAYLKELFADAFSTYFLGPAYAYARVCLRLDPNTALQDYPSEPSLARRVHVIAQMLGKMSERASEVDPLSSNAYAPETKLLMDLWQNTIAMIHAGYIAELNFSRPYDRWAEIMYNKLEDTYFDVGFSIRHWEAAKALGEQLRTDDDMTSDVAAISLPIVLNAAWYSRMRYPERVDSIENRARKLMREISDRRTDSLPQPIGGKLGPQTQTVDGTTKVI